MAQLRHRALLEMNHVIHSGSLRIFPRRLDYLAVNIVALNVYLYGIIHHLGRFIDRVVPAFLRNQVCPALRQEERFMPGAIFAAIIAASIGKVPLPQNGSTRIRSTFHGVRRISAAASVSVIGALLVI